MRVDLGELNKRVEQKLINVQKHPDCDLFIYNYTSKCTYSKSWDEYTLMCRGLILDIDGNVKAKCFPKFFNLEEHKDPLPVEPFQVFDKYDGSLGISYWIDGKPYVATRGSFTSDQAIKANELLQRKYLGGELDPSLTYLWEILYQQNRIVVDYGDREELILLATYDIETCEEIPLINIYPFPVVRPYFVTDITKLRDRPKDNAEGYVVRFQSGLRLKLKYAEYLRLHKLLTQVSSYSIWELMKNDQPFDELLERVPDEYYSWVRNTQASINAEYNSIARSNKEVADAIITHGYDTRKQMAEMVMEKAPHPAVTFNMIDNKQYSDMIWKLVKPKYSQPFRTDIDT